MQNLAEFVKFVKEEAPQRVFADLWGFCIENIRWIPEWKSFALFDKKRWRRAADLILVRLLVRMFRVEYGLEDSPIDPAIIGELNTMARRYLQTLKPHVVFSASGFDANPHLLNMQNGTLNTLTTELMHHDPKHNCTKITGTGYSVSADQPTLFIKLIRDMIQLSPLQIDSEGYTETENDERVEYVRRLLCACFLGPNTDSLLHFLVGEGRNGKSVLADFIYHLFGGYATGVDSRLISQRYASPKDLGYIARHRIGIIPELGAASEFNTTTVKLLTGGDRVPAKDDDVSESTVNQSTHLLIHTNYLPRIKDRSLAIWRRIRVIQCGNPISAVSCDRELRFKLRAEAELAVNWILQAHEIVRRDGLIAPKSIVDATDTYNEDSNPMTGYLEYFDIEPDATRITRNHPYFTTSTDMNFIHEVKVTLNGGDKVSAKELCGRWKAEGVIPCKRTIAGKTYRGFAGVRPKSGVPTVEINYDTLTQIVATENRAVA